jgi:hypothetical protein
MRLPASAANASGSLRRGDSTKPPLGVIAVDTELTTPTKSEKKSASADDLTTTYLRCSINSIKTNKQTNKNKSIKMKWDLDSVIKFGQWSVRAWARACKEEGVRAAQERSFVQLSCAHLSCRSVKYVSLRFAPVRTTVSSHMYLV